MTLNSNQTITATFATVSQPSPSAAQTKAILLRQITPRGRAAKITALFKSHEYVLLFKALSAGRVVIDWYYLPTGAHLASAKPKPVLIADGRATFSRAGTLRLKIELTSNGKRLLRHPKRLKLTAKGTFTPTGKHAIVATKKFTLTR